jgi:hypothetical protein
MKIEQIEDEVSRWRFYPSLADGKPVAFHIRATIVIHVDAPAAILRGAIRH